MINKRLLYAPNIHQGGGKALLLPILATLKYADDVMFVLDARMTLPEGGLVGKVYWVQPTVFSRLYFEWYLRSIVSEDMLLLCMGNLPPLFVEKGWQSVFVQNRYLIDDVSLNKFSFGVRLRLMVERRWLKFRSRYVKNFIVQTMTMQKLLRLNLKVQASVQPFMVLSGTNNALNTIAGKKYDFVYVASGESHKKHRALIKGWIKLAKQGFFPSLCLTLNKENFSSLCMWIQEMKEKYNLCIEMKGELTYAQVQTLYNESKAMIYPSVFESFGVPLLEAAFASLPILTADADYVYDVIKPTGTFNVESPASIADAVKRGADAPAEIVLSLLSVDEFLESCFSCDHTV